MAPSFYDLRIRSGTCGRDSSVVSKKWMDKPTALFRVSDGP
jgi:hypothetical protein